MFKKIILFLLVLTIFSFSVYAESVRNHDKVFNEVIKPFIEARMDSRWGDVWDKSSQALKEKGFKSKEDYLKSANDFNKGRKTGIIIINKSLTDLQIINIDHISEKDTTFYYIKINFDIEAFVSNDRCFEFSKRRQVLCIEISKDFEIISFVATMNGLNGNVFVDCGKGLLS